MTALRRCLLILLVIRLLMPPGICLCQETSPASRLLLGLIDPQRQLPPTAPEEEDDHDPGCPASHLAAGMGLYLGIVAVLPPLPDAWLDLPGLVLPAPCWFQSLAPSRGPSPPGPIYLDDCALLI